MGYQVGQVARFTHAERILIDARRMEALFSRLGHRRAEAYVTGTVEEMTDLLAALEAQYRSGNLEHATAQARRVSRMAADIGLTSLARVARDLGIVAPKGDKATLGAIWARLQRIGDRSLQQLWEQPGLSL